MKIIIIGAGIAGLAIAVRLASRGHEVHVFEANSYPGGKLSDFSLRSKSQPESFYRFDAGPSLFTMPQYVKELFDIACVPMSDYFSYIKTDVVCQYFWEDGTELTGYADSKKLEKEVENKLGINGKIITKALDKARYKYNIAGTIFLENSLHKIKTWLSWGVLKALVLMPTLDIFSTMNTTHEKILEKNPKLVQYFNRFATYNGSNPYKASGMLSMIPHFEHGIGSYYPAGGMSKITQAIYKVAQLKGVRFHFNTKVSALSFEPLSLSRPKPEAEKILNSKLQIQSSKLKITGIKTENGEKHKADAIVSNMDVYFTYKKLLPTLSHPEKTLNQERSTSALIFYWGIRKTFSQLHLHNIFFSDDYKKEFENLSRGTLCDDPTVYVNITSSLTSSDAPENCENWFVMVNAPSNSVQDWEELIVRTKKNIIEKLSRILKTDISDLIDAEEVLSPLGIESKTQSYAGALYGTSSNNRMSAFLRHANFTSQIKNLYFCGGSVHPGGGIPLCLLSAKIVDELVG